MAWSCMAASRTGSLVFTDDITTDRNRWEQYIELYSIPILIKRSNKDKTVFPKQTMNNESKGFRMQRSALFLKCNYIFYFSNGKSPTLIPVEHAFLYLLTTTSRKTHRLAVTIGNYCKVLENTSRKETAFGEVT